MHTLCKFFVPAHSTAAGNRVDVPMITVGVPRVWQQRFGLDLVAAAQHRVKQLHNVE